MPRRAAGRCHRLRRQAGRMSALAAERADGPGPQRRRTLAALALLGLAAAAPVLTSPAGRPAGAAGDRCRAPLDLAALGAPLPRTAARLAARQPLTIVAFGSSST